MARRQVIFVGVDPGHSGAIAVLRGGDRVPSVTPMPVVPYEGKTREVDVLALASLLVPLAEEGEVGVVAVERVNANGTDFGAASAFTFGKGLGEVCTTVRLLGLPLLLVRPQAWKRKLLRPEDHSKKAAIEWAKDTYPGVNLRPPKTSNKGPQKGESHDFAEACCLLRYGQLYSRGEL